MGRTESLGVIVLMTLLLAAVPAHAQTTEEWRKSALLRVGPLYLGPTLVIDNLGVDNNVFNDQTGPQLAFTASVTPGATIWLPYARRALITVQTGLGLVYFQKFANQSYISPNVGVTGDLALQRLTVSASGATSRSNQRPNFEIDARARRVQNSATASFSVAVTDRLSVALSGRESAFHFDAGAVFLGISLAETLNRTEQRLTLNVRQRLTSLTTVYVIAEAGRDRFDIVPLRNSDGVRVMPGIEFKPKAFISGSAEVGVRRFNALDPHVPDFTGVVAKAALLYRFQDTTQVGVTWNRDIEYSILATEPYYLANLVGVTIRRQLAGRYDTILGVTRNGSSYFVLDSSPQPSGQHTGSYVYSVDVGYRVNRLTRVGFAVSTSARSSTATSPGYQGFRAGLSLRYGL